MIQVQNLSLFYEEHQALNAVHLTIKPGVICGLAGINGAGKSSLINCLLGLISEFEGQISINGHDVRKDRSWIKSHCGYAPEETELFDYLTGLEFLQLIASVKRLSQPQKAIKSLSELFDMADFLPLLIAGYSHGMRQKMLLSAALMGEPDFIFIDEAINGLDTLSLLRLKKYLQALKGQGKTVVIASHVLPLLADWCDEILILHQGRLLKTLVQNEMQNADRSIEQIFMEIIGQ
ncbi:ABC transporter ATP-binding protein [Calditrichota bacterium GD2]